MTPTLTRLYLQQDWNNDIPYKFLWTVEIAPRAGSYFSLASNINNILNKYERTDLRRDWPVRPDVFASQSDPRGGLGFMFVDSVALPLDSYQVNTVDINQNAGFIPAYYSSKRTDYGASAKLDITFLETNTDVIDYFIRPWIIASSHVGLIEKGQGHSEDLKCNITLRLYTRDRESYNERDSGLLRLFPTTGIFQTRLSRMMQLRKQFTFFNACPYVVEGGQLNYDSNMGVETIKKTVAFTFSRYNSMDLSQGFR